MTEICRETGVVVRVDGTRAYVNVRRADACHACEVESACHALSGGAMDVTLEVENTLGATEGTW